jgi:hypothetical protein
MASSFLEGNCFGPTILFVIFKHFLVAHEELWFFGVHDYRKNMAHQKLQGILGYGMWPN